LAQESTQKGIEMLLAIRVTLTIFFSAIALLAQTPDGKMFALKASESLNAFASIPSYQGQESKTSDPITFKVDLAQRFADDEDFILASNAPVRPESPSASSQGPASRPKAFSYSTGYATRHKIHKYASFATLPLIVSEAIVGQKLMNDRSNSSLRSAHSGLTAGLGVLFGLESVTGIWNMLEARKKPSGHGKRMLHGILMLAADVGFVATAATAPHRNEHGIANNSNASTHRAIAYGSFGVATVSYLYMLFAR
jgi:hypothetical protein